MDCPLLDVRWPPPCAPHRPLVLEPLAGVVGDGCSTSGLPTSLPTGKPRQHSVFVCEPAGRCTAFSPSSSHVLASSPPPWDRPTVHPRPLPLHRDNVVARDELAAHVQHRSIGIATTLIAASSGSATGTPPHIPQSVYESTVHLPRVVPVELTAGVRAHDEPASGTARLAADVLAGNRQASAPQEEPRAVFLYREAVPRAAPVGCHDVGITGCGGTNGSDLKRRSQRFLGIFHGETRERSQRSRWRESRREKSSMISQLATRSSGLARATAL